jgi:hypothetical protein
MIFESCPPISMIVLISGLKTADATPWAVISFFTTSAPVTAAASDRPLPVVPTPMIPLLLYSFPNRRSPSFTASMGFPLVFK